MLNFITNQKFLENFVSIYAKDNTDCFLFCIYGALLKREDLLKFVIFFEVAYLKIMQCGQCYCIWRFLGRNQDGVIMGHGIVSHRLREENLWIRSRGIR